MSFLKALVKKWVKPLWTAVTKIATKIMKLFAEALTRIMAWHREKLITDSGYALALVTLAGAIGRIILPLQWILGFFGDLMREIFSTRNFQNSRLELEAWDSDYTYRDATSN